ncbi:MAG TPA: bifunctional DNA-formamidopyrimidine glycosylase/DNA-(apurinic or apyrimidinic site) lyase [Candidatus Saccharimonadaceae bacterium]|nr:bifunctional DNA-formamidopyrimidine glycosylase/DNA-(apurinic or apyrimidinic site) lyase [Candidatus Saccharimonadaceae bacterium]
MPELPEVETVRRMLETSVRGRTVRAVALSGLALRRRVPREVPRALAGRTLLSVGRHGKVLLLGFDGGMTLVSHLGMSGRWLFFPDGRAPRLPHVHARVRFTDGSRLWFQDTRRFGLLRAVPTASLARDPALRGLGPDPMAAPPRGADLRVAARGLRLAIKPFLLDQRRVAGIGNIYASEILFRAGVSPRLQAGRVREAAWDAIAREIPRVLGEAVERLGTTFRSYRTLWGEPGGFGEQLRVYDRAGAPCSVCGRPIRRIVQAQRATYFCPHCQRGGVPRAPSD